LTAGPEQTPMARGVVLASPRDRVLNLLHHTPDVGEHRFTVEEQLEVERFDHLGYEFGMAIT
jgi:hypothetical protein